VKKVWE